MPDKIVSKAFARIPDDDSLNHGGEILSIHADDPATIAARVNYLNGGTTTEAIIHAIRKETDERLNHRKMPRT